MSQESDEYEKFIAGIIDDIKSTGRKIEIICYGRDCKLQGEAGQKHQIDVAFLDHSFSPTVLVLVECKLRKKRNVTPEVPKIASFNQDDIGALNEYAEKTMTILVTTCGYSKGAKLISDSRQLRREIVPFKADSYTFRYENIVMIYSSDELGAHDSFEAEQIRNGKIID